MRVSELAEGRGVVRGAGALSCESVTGSIVEAVTVRVRRRGS